MTAVQNKIEENQKLILSLNKKNSSRFIKKKSEKANRRLMKNAIHKKIKLQEEYENCLAYLKEQERKNKIAALRLERELNQVNKNDSKLVTINKERNLIRIRQDQDKISKLLNTQEEVQDKFTSKYRNFENFERLIHNISESYDDVRNFMIQSNPNLKQFDFKEDLDGWLDDEHISSYFNFLKSNFSNFDFVEPSIVSLVGYDEMQPVFDATELKINSKTDIIAYPTNLGNHWVALIWDIRKKSIYIFNSFGGNGYDNMAQKLKSGINNILIKKKMTNNLIANIENRVIRGIQNDGFSCGTYIMAFVETYLLDLEYPKTILSLNKWVEGGSRGHFGVYKKYAQLKLFEYISSK